MKKQPVYRIMKKGLQTWVTETPGYLYEIVTPHGTVTVGLIWINYHWFATHYDSGLDCTPASNKHGEHLWRDKALLLDTVKDIPFHKFMHQAQPYIDMVNKYKEASKYAEMDRKNRT